MILLEVIPEIIKQLNYLQNLVLPEIEVSKKQLKARPEKFSSNHLDYSHKFPNFVGIKTKTYEMQV